MVLFLRLFSSAWLHGRIPLAKGSVPLRQILQSRDSDFIDLENQVWKVALVMSFFSHKDSEDVLSMELPSHNVRNFMVWSHHISGHFTSKTAYAHLMQQSSNSFHSLMDVNRKGFKILWHLPILTKWKFFIYMEIFT